MGAFIHRQMAESPGADGGREAHRARKRDAAGWGHYALNAKDNFRFERTIVGWRSGDVLDLRRKR